MEFRGGCCIARYGDEMSKVDRIMLRFRPIAPKPVSGGSNATPREISAGLGSKTGRGKRKYAKTNIGRSSDLSSIGCKKKRRNDKMEVSGGATAEMVALPLLPADPVSSACGFPVIPADSKRRNSPVWLDFGRCRNTARSPDPAAVSWVTVEAGTAEVGIVCDEYSLGCCTDEEKMMRLEKDTCPGFVSDGSGKVTWTNRAFRDLVMGTHDKEEHHSHKDRRMMMKVWLVMREREILAYPAFTCRVRLQYTCRDKERASMTVPCDVWRMNDGGSAWRLDTDAALCLGR